MKSNTKKTALALAALLMLGFAPYPASAQVLGPNSINNQMIDTSQDPDVPLNMRHGSGVYDGYDPYRTPQGFPLPGWGHLRGMS